MHEVVGTLAAAEKILADAADCFHDIGGRG
jgi:hypothetical protein